MTPSRALQSLTTSLLLASLSVWPAAAQTESDMQRAVETAAEYLAVDPGQVVLLRAEEVEWSDSSLGCPLPGRFYLQVLTPGWLVEVTAGDRVLELHGSTRGQVVLCGDRPSEGMGEFPLEPETEPDPEAEAEVEEEPASE